LANQGVDDRLRFGQRGIFSNIADDADHLVQRRLAVGSDADARTERITCGPETACHAFIDDDRGRRIGMVARVERPTGEPRDAQQREVLRRTRPTTAPTDPTPMTNRRSRRSALTVLTRSRR
jgi:hypothetical protein